MAKPSIAIVGAGRLGSALALSLGEAGYLIEEVISRPGKRSRSRAGALARRVAAEANTIPSAKLSAGVVWFCVPDREIAACAKMLARAVDWKGKIGLHPSGALASSELNALKVQGALVASVHPLMTFVTKIRPSVPGVPFAVEGDGAAVRVARQLVRDMGGEPFAITKAHKAAYHAWGAFTSPLLVSALATAELVAAKAGMSRKLARHRMEPIVRQTLANYFQSGPADAFSGPIIRGDAATVQKHLKVLERIPVAKQVYLALARAAVKNLPTRNKGELSRILRG